MVANLTCNAVKFTPEQGRVLVEVTTTATGALQVNVNDSGPGLPSGDEERVFDRLYQSDKEDAATLGGLGMGLYISREIVELHGGTIRYAQSPLGGAQFSFTIPMGNDPL